MEVVEGLLVGVLAAAVIIYSMRTTVFYPTWLLNIFEHPWMFVLLFIVIVYILTKNATIGGLLALMFAALLADHYVLTRPVAAKSWDAKPRRESDSSDSSDSSDPAPAPEPDAPAGASVKLAGLPATPFYYDGEQQPGDPAPFSL